MLAPWRSHPIGLSINQSDAALKASIWKHAWWTIGQSRDCFRCISFWSTVLNRTCFQVFINIIFDIEETETLTVTWFRFLFRCIFIPDSCLLAITITIWPVTPCTTVTWLVTVTRAIWNRSRVHGRRLTGKFQCALDLVPLINCFDLLETKCPIFELNLLR